LRHDPVVVYGVWDPSQTIDKRRQGPTLVSVFSPTRYASKYDQPAG